MSRRRVVDNPRELYNALARRPELRDRLLALPPQRWIVRGGQATLPRSVQDPIRRWYERFWQLPSSNGSPLHVPDPPTHRLYASHTHVRIDKAREILRFAPAFDLRTGMTHIAAWAQWAGLLPQTSPVG